ncbi:MAG: gliding motility-associated ABC transporter substrate-binding protein GldG [Paludibacteraceae bacterium]|nr:gliding motility-associated ABC transporter substrate-binding protein GldG [Paludibacteraceae bacterium]
MAKKIVHIVLLILSTVALYFISEKFFFRLDLTSEKRYSISDNTKRLLEGLEKPLNIKIYLDGDLNPGFLRLKRATKEMLDEFSAYCGSDIDYEFINPSSGATNAEREKNYTELEKRGMRGTMVYDRDNEGKAIQKIIYPWAEINYDGKTLPVCLLKNVAGNSGEENLNISIENLEFGLTDVIRMLYNREVQKIAFIEGHGEFPEPLVYDASQGLSHYYQVDRGSITNDVNILDGYKAIIIAGPESKFTEQEKYVIDQYIMKGGKVLWLLDGSRISLDSLSTNSQTIGIINEVNLEDQLFTYGVRINPVLVQNVQCALVPVNMAREGDQPKYEPSSWYYSPLLMTSPEHPATRNLTPVKSEFTSSIDFVGSELNVKREVLLATSPGSHIQSVPSIVSMDVINVEKNAQYFNISSRIFVGVAEEGIFPSVFRNRLIPEGIQTKEKTLTESKPTKMVFVADADIIRNDVQGSGENMNILPLGFDRYMNQQFGNKDFILNAVNYLTDDDGWMELRNREIKLRLLHKPSVIGLRTFWQTANMVFPLLLLGLFGGIFLFIRKRKYTK